MSTFYGIGVGPGNPDLLTKQAIDRLQSVDRIAAPAAETSERSMALETIHPFAPEDTPVDHYFFPLTGNRADVRAFWEKAAEEIQAHLSEGADVAFLTLGDPGFYSTCTLLTEHLSEDVPIQLIPGITSIQTAASRIQRPVTKKNELFTTLTGHHVDEMGPLLNSHDTIAVLKPNKNTPRLKQLVTEHSTVEQATLVTRCGQDNEQVMSFFDVEPEEVDYFSVLLIFTRS